MKKLTPKQGFWLLYFMNGGLLDDPYLINSSPDDAESIKELINMGYIDKDNVDKPMTEEGISRCHTMLKLGINFDSYMKELSLNSKRALFLSLVNSGYEPRGIFPVMINKLSPIGFSQLKKGFFKRLNSTNPRKHGPQKNF